MEVEPMSTETNVDIKSKKTFVQKMMEIREKYADVLADPEWKGLEIPKDDSLDEEYDKK